MKNEISFGCFLIEIKLIDENDLLEALDYQLNHRMPAGKVAVIRGDLTPRQVLEVLRRQEEVLEYRSFGVVAVQLGYLSEKKVNAILEHQRMFRESLSMALLSLKKIKKEDMRRALEEFERQESEEKVPAENLEEPLNVLVVDDEQPVCVNIAALLKLNGFRVDTALNAFEAQKKMEEREFQVIVSDVNMPEMSGISLLALIQEKHPWAETIMITGYANERIIQSILRKRAFGLVEKPLRFPELLELVREAGIHYTRRKSMMGLSKKK